MSIVVGVFVWLILQFLHSWFCFRKLRQMEQERLEKERAMIENGWVSTMSTDEALLLVFGWGWCLVLPPAFGFYAALITEFCLR